MSQPTRCPFAELNHPILAVSAVTDLRILLARVKFYLITIVAEAIMIQLSRTKGRSNGRPFLTVEFKVLRLVDVDTGFLDDWTPFFDLSLEMGPQRRRRCAIFRDRFGAKFGEPMLDVVVP